MVDLGARNIEGQALPGIRFARFWVDYWPTLVLVVANAGLALAALVLQGHDSAEPYRTDPWAWTFAVSLIATAAGAIATAVRTQSVTRLQARVSELEDDLDLRTSDYYDRLEEELKQLAVELGLQSEERVTVYKHTGGAFVRLGRFSENPKYRKPGRASYPDNAGFLGRTWQSGFVFENGLPDPAREAPAYWAAHKRMGVAKKTAKKFNMRSRTFAGRRAYYGKEKPSGCVIMVESTRVGAFDQSAIEAKLKGAEAEKVRLFLEKNRGSEPDPSLPKKEGL